VAQSAPEVNTDEAKRVSDKKVPKKLDINV
jgi:hypothetical protein